MRAIAVDWSGAATRAARKIWLAEVCDGAVTRLETGRDRHALCDHLIDEARRDPAFVVGLDFAFSFPAWFARGHGAATAAGVWRLARDRGEAWLRACEPPFWGRAARPRPDHPRRPQLRRTDEEFPAVNGVRPKPVFQIGGAGSVGAGSVRGMPVVLRLHEAGFSVWPFDPPGWPRVIEIYPRALTGPVRKTDPAARRARLARYPRLAPIVRETAARSDDAFDALVSALEMWRHRAALSSLPPARDARERIEGAIWRPDGEGP
ncbi:MAG TPA: hypothetical protein VEZ14_12730 [Dehalococcoidia bacterium]|nr:hypothetical protein [Dehalococcoidia bacterium]